MEGKINTEHHKFLVATHFTEGEDEPEKTVVTIEKTDQDELCIRINEDPYYVSLAQFLLCLKLSDIGSLGIFV